MSHELVPCEDCKDRHTPLGWHTEGQPCRRMAWLAKTPTEPTYRLVEFSGFADTGRALWVDAQTIDRGCCGHCPASREGCEARQAFAQRCCTRCTHPADCAATEIANARKRTSA